MLVKRINQCLYVFNTLNYLEKSIWLIYPYSLAYSIT
jgi:hypothetical protein